jgi:REP element-mobilizing transposase RayT
MILNKYGHIANHFWNEIPQHYPNVFIDEFIVMPNHIHGIIIIANTVVTEQGSVPTKYGLLSKVIKSFKSAFTKNINQQFPDNNFKWQRSFYDHIIRKDEALEKIRLYIINNPIKWNMDRNNVENIWM